MSYECAIDRVRSLPSGHNVEMRDKPHRPRSNVFLCAAIAFGVIVSCGIAFFINAHFSSHPENPLRTGTSSPKVDKNPGHLPGSMNKPSVFVNPWVNIKMKSFQLANRNLPSLLLAIFAIVTFAVAFGIFVYKRSRPVDIIVIEPISDQKPDPGSESAIQSVYNWLHDHTLISFAIGISAFILILISVCLICKSFRKQSPKPDLQSADITSQVPCFIIKTINEVRKYENFIDVPQDKLLKREVVSRFWNYLEPKITIQVQSNQNMDAPESLANINIRFIKNVLKEGKYGLIMVARKNDFPNNDGSKTVAEKSNRPSEASSDEDIMQNGNELETETDEQQEEIQLEQVDYTEDFNIDDPNFSIYYVDLQNSMARGYDRYFFSLARKMKEIMCSKPAQTSKNSQ